MRVLDWGLIPYQEAVKKQLELVEEISAAPVQDESVGFLVFCTHPAVVTVGRGTKPGDIFSWSGETIETSRGGRATYHGPNQIVVYPIINLSTAQKFKRDLHGYLRALENSIVDTLKEFGIVSEARTIPAGENTPSLTGVWVGQRKIASIGIAVKKWVTYHGLALNLDYDVEAFAGIKPCGFEQSTMVSVAEILQQNKGISNFHMSELREKFKTTLAHNLEKQLNS